MTGKRAALNRVLLLVCGTLLTALGAGSILLATNANAETTWRSVTGSGVTALKEAALATSIPGSETHWVAAGALVLAAAAAALLLAWLMAQRPRFRRTAARSEGTTALGPIDVDNAVLEQLIENRLGTDPGIISTRVRSVPIGRQRTGIRIRVTARRGAAPAHTAQQVNRAANEAQQILGQQIPVLVIVRAGAHASRGHAQRVV